MRDGNTMALDLFTRHYSFGKHRTDATQGLIVGPGQKEVLLSRCSRALFVWRKFIDDSGQEGVNCAVFRNEGAGRSSDLILEAEEIARQRWGEQRFYTYVNPRAVRSTNPGFCFLAAGWRRCGISKVRKYLILEKT